MCGHINSQNPPKNQSKKPKKNRKKNKKNRKKNKQNNNSPLKPPTTKTSPKLTILSKLSGINVSILIETPFVVAVHGDGGTERGPTALQEVRRTDRCLYVFVFLFFFVCFWSFCFFVFLYVFGFFVFLFFLYVFGVFLWILNGF